jgi:hypothetical protein
MLVKSWCSHSARVPVTLRACDGPVKPGPIGPAVAINRAIRVVREGPILALSSPQIQEGAFLKKQSQGASRWMAKASSFLWGK